MIKQLVAAVCLVVAATAGAQTNNIKDLRLRDASGDIRFRHNANGSFVSYTEAGVLTSTWDATTGEFDGPVDAANVTGLSASLSGKADAVHGHIISDTTGLQTALDGKSDTGHTHAFSALTGTASNAQIATGVDAAKVADGSVSNTEFQYINSLSSNAQTQISARLPATITAAATGEYIRYNGSAWVDAVIAAGDLPSSIDATKIGGGGVTTTEFNYIGGLTSDAQTQLAGKASLSGATFTNSVAVQGDFNADNADIVGTVSAGTADIVGTVTAAAFVGDGSGLTGISGGGGASDLDDLSDVAITGAATADYLRFNGTNWVDSPLQLGDMPAGVALLSGASFTGNVNMGGNDFTAANIEVTANIDCGNIITATNGYVGIQASNLPTSIDATKIGGGGVTSTEFDYIGTLSSNAQTQISARLPATITAAATGEYIRYNGSAWVDASIAAGDLPSSIDATKIGAGGVTTTEFGYIGTLSSDAQTQITARGALTGTNTWSGANTFTSTNTTFGDAVGEGAIVGDVQLRERTGGSLMLRSTVTNSATVFSVSPNGTGGSPSFSSFEFFTNDVSASEANFNRMVFFARDDTTPIVIFSNNNGSKTRKPFAIYADRTGWDETGDQLYLATDGRIGMGTATPTAGTKLDINGALRVGGDVGFYGTSPIAKQSITGATTLEQLKQDLEDLGLFTYTP